MKTNCWLLTLLVVVGLTLGLPRGLASDPEQGVRISKEDIMAHFSVLQRMDPKKNANLWEKLVALHGDHKDYSPDEVRDVTGPPKKFTFPPEEPEQRDVNKPVPPGAIDKVTAERSVKVAAEIVPKKTKAEVIRDLEKQFANKTKEDVIQALAEAKPMAADPVAQLHKNAGDQPWYTAQELRDQESGTAGETSIPLPSIPAPTGWDPIVEGFKHFKIRQSWSDLLYAEDLTQPANASKTINDLVGAKFSWADDFTTDSKIWSAVGAIVVPMDWRLPGGQGQWWLDRVVLAPSFSINRVSNEVDPKKDVDALYYRLGLLSEWQHPYGALQVRGAFVYGTDTAHQAELPAFEFDLEPQLGWFTHPPIGHEETAPAEASFPVKYLQIGYKNIVIPKQPELEDQSDNSVLDYQIRTYLHIEGGDLQRVGSTWNVTPGSFFRIGPAAELRINFPNLVFRHGLGLTGQYSYLPAISGTTEHGSLLKLSATLTLLENSVTHQKISLSGDYTTGGLDLTKQDVNIFTLGLSVLF